MSDSKFMPLIARLYPVVCLSLQHEICNGETSGKELLFKAVTGTGGEGGIIHPLRGFTPAGPLLTQRSAQLRCLSNPAF